MKAITFSLAMVLFLAVLSQAAVSPEVVQAASGTYTGRQLGVRGGQFVTLILSPDGRATISLAPVPGGQAVYSRGVWRMVTSDFIRVNVGGMAGTGILEFQRFDGQLRLTRNDVGLRSDFPLQLYQHHCGDIYGHLIFVGLPADFDTAARSRRHGIACGEPDIAAGAACVLDRNLAADTFGRYCCVDIQCRAVGETHFFARGRHTESFSLESVDVGLVCACLHPRPWQLRRSSSER